MIEKNVCGVCGSRQFKIVGRSSHGDDVQIAGIPVRLEDDRYEIRKCGSCHFRWKSPQLSYDGYLKYYAISTMEDWNLDPPKIHSRRLQEKQQIVERFVRGGRVLDIGCWRGDFLRYWGTGWQKFGIELSDAGRQACCNNGIRIIGKTIEDITDAGVSFDVICMMDLLEHLPDPFDQLKSVTDCLVPEGALVIETGDADSILARVMGSDWHYYSAAEHISFFCDHSLNTLLKRLGVTSGGIWHWPHMILARWHVMNQWYMASRFKWPVIRPRHLVRTLIQQGRIPRKEGCPPWLTGAKDHFFVVGLKTEN